MRKVERDVVTDRRQYERRGGAPVAVEVDAARVPAGEVVDRSAGGLKLALPRPLTVGARLRVLPVTAPDVPWAEVVVRHVRPGAGGWLVGCRYTGRVVSPEAFDALVRACAILRLPVRMPDWFRAFAASTLDATVPESAADVAGLPDGELRRLYAAVRGLG